MKTVIAIVEGVSPYSQGRPYEVEKLQGEGFEDYEVRTWRERLHVDSNKMVFIPPMAYKNALAEAAKFLSIRIPGGKSATYTKHFEAGVLAVEPATLNINVGDVKSERLFVPSDGRPGGGSRVYKIFPLIQPGWKAEFKFIILDETVLQTSVTDPTKSVFEFVLMRTGQFIGIGRFRPKNRGYYGRFKIEELVIVDED